MDAERERSLHAALPDAAGQEWGRGKLLQPDSMESKITSTQRQSPPQQGPGSLESRPVGSWSHDLSRELQGRRSRSEFAAAEENHRDSIGQEIAAASPSSLCDAQRLPIHEIEASDVHQSGGCWGEEDEREEQEEQDREEEGGCGPRE